MSALNDILTRMREGDDKYDRVMADTATAELEQLQTIQADQQARIARRDKKILALLKKYDNMFLQDNFASVRVSNIRAELAELAQAADTEAEAKQAHDWQGMYGMERQR